MFIIVRLAKAGIYLLKIMAQIIFKNNGGLTTTTKALYYVQAQFTGGYRF